MDCLTEFGKPLKFIVRTYKDQSKRSPESRKFGKLDKRLRDVWIQSTETAECCEGKDTKHIDSVAKVMVYFNLFTKADRQLCPFESIHIAPEEHNSYYVGNCIHALGPKK